MKKIGALVIGLILLAFLSSCNREDEQNIYGVYEFEEISYLSSAISATKEYVESHIEGTRCTIKEDLFKIEFPGETIEFSSPKYIKEEIFDEASTLSEIYTFIDSDADYQYTIYDKDGNNTNWILYVSSDKIWIIKTYIDNTADGSERIIYVFKLSKLSN